MGDISIIRYEISVPIFIFHSFLFYIKIELLKEKIESPRMPQAQPGAQDTVPSEKLKAVQ